MNDEKEKMNLFARLTGNKKTKKNSCCCNFEVEEIPEEDKKNTNDEIDPKTENNS